MRTRSQRRRCAAARSVAVQNCANVAETWATYAMWAIIEPASHPFSMRPISSTPPAPTNLARFRPPSATRRNHSDDKIDVAPGYRNRFPHFPHCSEVQFNGFANILLGLLQSRSSRDATRQVRNIGRPIGFGLFEDNRKSSHDSFTSVFLRLSAEPCLAPRKRKTNTLPPQKGM